VKDNLMVVTLNADELPDWIEDSLLGVDVMFDEMSYRGMEFALKEVMKAENNRVSEFREILLANDKPSADPEVPFSLPHLNTSQISALQKVLAARDVAFVHGPPGTGKTTTLVETIAITLKNE